MYVRGFMGAVVHLPVFCVLHGLSSNIQCRLEYTSLDGALLNRQLEMIVDSLVGEGNRHEKGRMDLTHHIYQILLHVNGQHTCTHTGAFVGLIIISLILWWFFFARKKNGLFTQTHTHDAQTISSQT